MHGTFVASYQAVFAGGIGVQLGWTRPPKTTLSSVLRSIASSNACRSFALDASGVPTFVYGRLPTPFLLPMLMTIPDQPSWWRLDHPQARVSAATPGSSVVETRSSTWMSPAFSAAAAAAASGIGLKTILSR